MKKRKWERKLLAGGVLLTGCQSETETLVTTMQEQEEEPPEKVSEQIRKDTEEEKEIDWAEEIFIGENIFISYPVFSFKENECVGSLNQQIQEDALRILEYFDVNIESDTLDITYEIADITKDWISIVYCGSYSRADADDTTAVKYTSNLSLADGTHLRVAQMEPVEVLVQKIAKGAYRIIEEEEERKAVIQNRVAEMDIEELVRVLEAADFGMESYEAYPEWFSFWSTIEGETQISLVIPVPHALGDYAVLEIFSENLD